MTEREHCEPHERRVFQTPISEALSASGPLGSHRLLVVEIMHGLRGGVLRPDRQPVRPARFRRADQRAHGHQTPANGLARGRAPPGHRGLSCSAGPEGRDPPTPTTKGLLRPPFAMTAGAVRRAPALRASDSPSRRVGCANSARRRCGRGSTSPWWRPYAVTKALRAPGPGGRDQRQLVIRARWCRWTGTIRLAGEDRRLIVHEARREQGRARDAAHHEDGGLSCRNAPRVLPQSSGRTRRAMGGDGAGGWSKSQVVSRKSQALVARVPRRCAIAAAQRRATAVLPALAVCRRPLPFSLRLTTGDWRLHHAHHHPLRRDRLRSDAPLRLGALRVDRPHARAGAGRGVRCRSRAHRGRARRLAGDRDLERYRRACSRARRSTWSRW